MRSDAPLIRHLSKTYSPKLGFYWQKLPLVALADSMIHRALHGDGIEYRLDRLVWNDVVFHLDCDVPDRQTWVRLTEGEEYASRWERLSPWFPGMGTDPEKPDLSYFLMLEMWSPDYDKWRQKVPMSLLVDRRDPNIRVHTSLELMEGMARLGVDPDTYLEVGKSTGNSKVDEWMRTVETMGEVALCCMAYLAQCPEYLVEETPEIPEGTPPRRHNDPKPWTYNYLPRIILLDPTQAPSGEAKPYQGGTHASPRPHQRRGHWATLKASRFYQGRHAEAYNPETNPRRVFVKPAWVGPRDWIMSGNHYRVLNVEGQQA